MYTNNILAQQYAHIVNVTYEDRLTLNFPYGHACIIDDEYYVYHVIKHASSSNGIDRLIDTGDPISNVNWYYYTVIISVIKMIIHFLCINIYDTYKNVSAHLDCDTGDVNDDIVLL